MKIDGVSINTSFCDDIIKILNKQKEINNWIKTEYKQKPLLIYGNSGLCKTTIANYILKDYTKIYIDLSFCKENKDFNEFIEMSLYKKDIQMMFKDKNYKSLIIDDYDYIIENEKKINKSIIHFIKKLSMMNNYPIIIVGTFKSETIQKHKIYNFCRVIHINLSCNNFIDLTNKYFYNDNGNKNNKNTEILVKKSNFNFHNIKTNLEFHTDFHCIQKYENKLKNTDFMDTIVNNSIQENFRIISNDSIIIGFNILENLIYWQNNDKQNINLIDKIYENNCLGDNLMSKYNYIDYNYLILFHVISPLHYLKQIDYDIKTTIYNKYISRSIIYTHNQNLLKKSSLNYYILINLYNQISIYSNEKEFLKKTFYLQNIKNYMEKHMIDQTIYKKFIKYYEWLYDKQLNNDIQKLLF